MLKKKISMAEAAREVLTGRTGMLPNTLVTTLGVLRKLVPNAPYLHDMENLPDMTIIMVAHGEISIVED